MTSIANGKLASLYETDYGLWLLRTVAQLQSRDFDHIDLEHLIEELESLGKSDRRAISSYLMRLCEHLLKVRYWDSERETCLRAWTVEIRNFRIQIRAILSDSPSLDRYLQENFVANYQSGRKLFLDASGLAATRIPLTPEFTLDRALDEDWLPQP